MSKVQADVKTSEKFADLLEQIGEGLGGVKENFMGGRGASSGISVKGKVYGTEYTTLHAEEDIKFVKYNESKASKTPQETMTNNRVYVTINNKNEISAITYYDKENKRRKQ